MLTPSELKALDRRIAANADKLIAGVTRRLAPARKVTGAGRKPSSFVNIVAPECRDVLFAGEENWPLWVDDVLAGVCRLDWRSNGEREVPLSATKTLICLAMLETVDTYQISHLVHVDESSARRYYRACELAHKYLVAGFCNDKVRYLSYAEVFVYPRETPPQTDLDE